MCVAQFREYCGAMRHKKPNDSTSNDMILPYAPYTGKQGDLFFYANISRMKSLAKQGNEYAKKFIAEIPDNRS